MPPLQSFTSTSLRRLAHRPIFRSPATTASTAAIRPFATAPRTMAQQFTLKGISSLLNLKDGELKEVEVEGIEGGKVLLSKVQGKVHATTASCTHYGAPLAKGVLTSEGRVTCPWHGACFNVATGDVEDAPALDPLGSFSVEEKDGAVYITGEKSHIENKRRTLDIKCKASGQDQVVVVGGGSGCVGTIEALRGSGFKGPITVISAEGTQPYDRTKISKALLADLSKIAWRSESYYKEADIDFLHDEATAVDFSAKSVSTKSGKSYPYTKLVLAPGGSPRSLPLPGLKAGELGNVFLLRSIANAKEINAVLGPSGDKGPEKKKKVVVIGSSFIGMEVANCIAGQGHEVHVVGMESVPCEAVFGAKVGAVFQSLLEKAGVQFHMKASVEKATPSSEDAKSVGAVHLKDGTALPADLVIEGVGVAPATSFLKDNKAISLEKDGSIKVNERFQIPNVEGAFAIGDIATYPYAGANVRIEHWDVAQNAGRSVARTIAKPQLATKPFIPVFWSALGAQLRYCGHPVSGYDDVIIDGSLEVKDGKPPSFAAYYVKGEEVVAVASMMKDPVMTKSAELMRVGKMLSAKDIGGQGNVLTAQV